MRVLLAVILLFGCATVQERVEERWTPVAEIKLSDWGNLTNEQQAKVVVLVMSAYFKRTECYKATLNIFLKDDTLVFSIKCIQRMAEAKDERGERSTKNDEQGGAGGIVCHADTSRGSRYDQTI